MNALMYPTVQHTYTGNKYTLFFAIIIITAVLITEYLNATLRSIKKLICCHMLLRN